jgi:hypothetical protein
MAEFIKGLVLSQLFFEEGVRPVMARHFPNLAYATARLDGGSDVLGFDTPRSMDHDWGPRLTLFLTETDFDELRPAIDQALRQDLPLTIQGLPTNFSYHEDGSAVMSAIFKGPVNHYVNITTTRRFFLHYLAYDPVRLPELVEWLTFPQQRLRTVASGRVFHDQLGQLQTIRDRLAYYPHDLWLYLLANQWGRIAQEEHFVGRAGHVGDDIGSRLLAGRLIRDLIILCFLMERQYYPYVKWMGTAFGQLACAEKLQPVFERVLRAADWPAREAQLSAAYQIVAQMHNDLRITAVLPTEVTQFYSRPYLVLHADRFAEALRAIIADPAVRALPSNLGSIDQFVDSTDVLSYPEWFSRLRPLYAERVLMANS